MGISTETRASLVILMVWLSLGGVIVSIVAFAASWLAIIAEPVWLCLGLFPLSFFVLLLRFFMGRSSPAAIPGISTTDGLWLAILLVSSFAVGMFNAPPGGWRRGDAPYTRIYERGEIEMSPELAKELKVKLTRVVSWGAFAFFMIGVFSWRNLALAETHWMPPETLRKKIKRRRIFSPSSK
jgi:hypothetical protein